MQKKDHIVVIAEELVAAQKTSSWTDMVEYARGKIPSWEDIPSFQPLKGAPSVPQYDQVQFGARAAAIDWIALPQDMIQAVHIANSGGIIMNSLISDVLDINQQYNFHESERANPLPADAQRFLKKMGLGTLAAPELDKQYARVERQFVVLREFAQLKSESGIAQLDVLGTELTLYVPSPAAALQILREEFVDSPYDKSTTLKPELWEAIQKMAEQKQPAAPAKQASLPRSKGPTSIQ